MAETQALIDRARALDPVRGYRVARAEAIPFWDESFDLVVSYLTLIDIEDLGKAIIEMTRVLRPGGTLAIANLTSYSTAATHGGWQHDTTGREVLLLAAGLQLRSFSEPAAKGANPSKSSLYNRVPLRVVMGWERPVFLATHR